MPTITDWIMVVITAVYVVATIFICVFNGRSAKAAKEQTEEMKRQFYSINRPIVAMEIAFVKRAFLCLRMHNNGSQTAFNVKVELSQEFIDGLERNFKAILESDKGKTRTIGVGQYFDIFFGSTKYIKMESKPVITGRVTYNGINGSIYVEDFSIDMGNYATIYTVDSEVDDIVNALKEQNHELKCIREAIQHASVKNDANTETSVEEK